MRLTEIYDYSIDGVIDGKVTDGKHSCSQCNRQQHG